MTTFDAAWALRHEADRKRLAETGMYRLEDEADSCGVGMVVAIDGKPFNSAWGTNKTTAEQKAAQPQRRPCQPPDPNGGTSAAGVGGFGVVGAGRWGIHGIEVSHCWTIRRVIAARPRLGALP